MKILDRFTRDRASRYIWGGFTIVFLFGIVWAAQRQRDSLQQARLDAQASAVHHVQTTLFDNLNSNIVSSPILAQNYRNLIIPVTAEILTDPAVIRVRIWSPTGELLFSTAERDLIGQATNPNNQAILNAIHDQVTSSLTQETVAPRQGLEGSNEQLWQTFVPLHVPDRLSVVGAAEIDQRNSAIIAGTDEPWRNFQIFFGVGVVICAVFALLSLRKAHALVGVGVGQQLPLPVPAQEPDGSAAQVSGELKETKDQLRQAVEAAGFLEGKLKEARAAVPALDDQRVAELELQLHAAHEELEAARAQVPDAAVATRVKELEDQLSAEQVRRAQIERDGRDAELAAKAEAGKRIAELEEELRAARETVPADHDRAAGIAALASEVEAIKTELDGARAQADVAKFETQAARTEADRARAQLAEAEAKLMQMRSERGAPSLPAGVDAKAVAELEARVSEAEQRALEAERHLEELADERDADEELEVDPAAAKDLRERLARTAARKRLGVHDEPSDDAE